MGWRKEVAFGREVERNMKAVYNQKQLKKKNPQAYKAKKQRYADIYGKKAMRQAYHDEGR